MKKFLAMISLIFIFSFSQISAVMLPWQSVKTYGVDKIRNQWLEKGSDDCNEIFYKKAWTMGITNVRDESFIIAKDMQTGLYYLRASDFKRIKVLQDKNSDLIFTRRDNRICIKSTSWIGFYRYTVDVELEKIYLLGGESYYRINFDNVFRWREGQMKQVCLENIFAYITYKPGFKVLDWGLNDNCYSMNMPSLLRTLFRSSSILGKVSVPIVVVIASNLGLFGS